jgi:hypothetical protein
MRPYLIAALLGAVFTPLAAHAEELDFSAPDKAANKSAETALAASLKEARAAGASASVWARPFDLNGDGKPEIVGQIGSAYLCGGMGPCFFVLKASGAGYVEVFNVPGVDIVEVLNTKSQGWRDLLFNGEARWRFNGTTYDRAK